MKLKNQIYYLVYIKIKSNVLRNSEVLQAIEVMLNGSLKRLNYLNGANREALYDEYKEWLEVDEDNIISEGVLYCKHLG